MRLKEFVHELDRVLLPETAAEWDNCGLLVGRLEQPVSKALLALELTQDVLNEAIAQRCNLILTHHPVIFGSLRTLINKDSRNLIFQAIQNDIALYSAHTNFDAIAGGLNDFVAKKLDAKDIVVPASDPDQLLRILTIDEMSLSDTLDHIQKKLQVQNLRIVGNTTKQISRIGLVTGAGMDYAFKAFESGADLFLTGDIKYHEAMNCQSEGFIVVDAGHFGTEKFFAEAMSTLLSDHKVFDGIEWIVSAVERSPFRNHAINYFEIEPEQKDLPVNDLKSDSEKTENEIPLYGRSVSIYTDGGSRGNPGEAAIGFVIQADGEDVYRYGRPIGIQTNNIAEYQAVLFALKAARKMKVTSFTLHLDSQLVERQLKGVYQVKSEELRTLYQEVQHELSAFNHYEIVHIKREYNKTADKLVNMALDQEQCIEMKEF